MLCLGEMIDFMLFSVTKATLEVQMSVCSFVSLSESKTPKQHKIIHSTIPTSTKPITTSHTTSHTPSHTTSRHHSHHQDQHYHQPHHHHRLLISRLLSFSACFFNHYNSILEVQKFLMK